MGVNPILIAARQLEAAAKELNERMDRIEAMWADLCLCRRHAWSPTCPKHGLSAANPKGSAAQLKKDLL